MVTPPDSGTGAGAGRLPNDGGWSEYRRLVIKELERLSRENDSLHSRLAAAETNIALLKLQAGAWGAVAGAVVAIGAVMLRFISP